MVIYRSCINRQFFVVAWRSSSVIPFQLVALNMNERVSNKIFCQELFSLEKSNELPS